MPDAVVIGAGPNGLVAANVLADAGWSVEVLEEQPEPGGAVKSGEHVEPGFVNDRFSAFYPVAAASPVVRGFQLERYGLRWRHGPLAVAHPAADGTCAFVSRDLDETAASLDAFAPGDGEAWRALLVRRLGDESFRGDGGPRLLAGNALHADLLPEAPMGGFFGWFLCSLGQTVGFPFPEGGAGRLTEALVHRLETKGGRVTCNTRVTEIV